MSNFWHTLKNNRTKIWVGAITLLLVLSLVVSLVFTGWLMQTLIRRLFAERP